MERGVETLSPVPKPFQGAHGRFRLGLASVHGFITLVLEGQIGETDSSRALKARGLAALAAMVETVVQTDGGRLDCNEFESAHLAGARASGPLLLLGTAHIQLAHDS